MNKIRLSGLLLLSPCYKADTSIGREIHILQRKKKSFIAILIFSEFIIRYDNMKSNLKQKLTFDIRCLVDLGRRYCNY